MENSSKALLIAGSVLIAILLISLGMKVFNSSTAPTDQVESSMITTSKKMFNSKFLAYTGDSLSASKAKSFINEVITNNATDTHKILVNLYKPNSSDREISHANSAQHFQQMLLKIDSFEKNSSDPLEYKIYLSNCGTHEGGLVDGYVACMGIAPTTAH